MSTIVVRPSAVLSTNGILNPSAAATVLANLSDNSDATVVYNPVSAPGTTVNWAFRLGTPTIAAGEFIARIGWSMRWKGDSAGNYSIGTQLYTGVNVSPPGYYASLTPNNSSAFTTTQVAYIAKNWTLTEAAQLNLVWFDGRSNSSWGQTDHADIWASIYTLAPATAVPQNRTETSSVYPTISVNTTATIDWESGTLDWQNLRKVTVEVRIEQGGTTVGTGTLVSTGSKSVFFTATGTQAVSITTPDALPNGTYKIYARALRYREDGIVRADQYGAWSTAATLTMSAPLPATPTVTVTSDQVNKCATINVTPVATTGYSSPYIYVERSDDAGVTWTSVRGATGIVGSFGIATSFNDYEAPPGLSVRYRARIDATYATFLNSSAWSTPVAALINADTWNLKAIGTPTINAIGVNVVGKPTTQVSEDLGVFRPLGRKYPVVVSGTIGGWDGELTIICTTAAQWEQIKTLAEAQQVLRFESPFGEAKYIRLINGAKSDLGGTPTTPRRTIGLQYVEVAMPAIVVGQSDVVPVIPNAIDGGTANAVFGDFFEGGAAQAVQNATIDGGAAS